MEPLKIVFASHTLISGTFVVGSHHLARELARMGDRVLHISTPLTLIHLLRLTRNDDYAQRLTVWRRGGVTCADGVLDCVPMAWMPWQAGKWLLRRNLNSFLFTTPRLKKTARHFGFEPVDILLMGQPRFLGLEACEPPVIYLPSHRSPKGNQQ